MQLVQHGQRTMSKEIGYVDWDEIVQKAETNLEILDANKRRANIGEKIEKLALDFALKERAKYPEPVEKKKENVLVK